MSLLLSEGAGEGRDHSPRRPRAVWKKLSGLQVCPAGLTLRNAAGWPGEKQVARARLTRARADKGAGSPSWAFYRESRGSNSNQPTLTILGVGIPILDRKSKETEGTSGVLKSQGQGQGCLEYLSLPSNDSLSLALGNCGGLGPPAGPVLVLQPTPPGHSRSLWHKPPPHVRSLRPGQPTLTQRRLGLQASQATRRLWASLPP